MNLFQQLHQSIVKPVYATICNPLYGDCTTNVQVNTPKTFLNNLVGAVFSIFIIVGVLYFAWHFVMGGYHYMMTEGDSKKVEDAKHELTYGIIGLFVVFSVFAILKLISVVFGYDFTGNSISLPNLLSPPATP